MRWGRSPLLQRLMRTQSGPMGIRVLVCYASAAGSTAGIADRIAQVLRGAGFEVSCCPVGPDVDSSRVDALVLGSAVHDMAWLPAAIEFVRGLPHGQLPVWCFSVGAVEPRGPLTRLLARQEVKRVAESLPKAFTARDHRVFRGVVHLQGVAWWGRLFYRIVGGPAGDHRNWPRIEEWAIRIATDLTAVTRTVGPAESGVGAGPDVDVEVDTHCGGEEG